MVLTQCSPEFVHTTSSCSAGWGLPEDHILFGVNVATADGSF